MTMEIAERSHNPCGLFGWFNFERRNWVGAVGGGLLIGFSWGNGHTTQNAIKDITVSSAQKTAVIKRLQTKDIPALKSLVGCEHMRADVATVELQRQADSAPNLPKCPPIEVAKDLGKVPAQVTK